MFPSYLEVEKTGSYFEPTNTVAAIWRRKKWIPAIWRPKNVVHNCQEQEKDYDIYLKSEKLVHSQKSTKKMFPSYLEVEKTGSQLFRA